MHTMMWCFGSSIQCKYLREHALDHVVEGNFCVCVCVLYLYVFDELVAKRQVGAELQVEMS